MTSVSSQEQRREQPQSKEVYLESFEREWVRIHEGLVPLTGLKEKGKLERKEVCEDVKLKNRERGLFLVADGVSGANGWLASRETARVMYEKLGETLDRAIENNLKEALRQGESPLDRITTYVAAQMSAAVEQADARIRAMVTNPEFKGSATTLSLAKLVELPDGKGGTLQRLFFTNIGDSRIYVQRNGEKLKQVTRDDSALEHRVDMGEVTKEQARLIDQAPDPARLPPSLHGYARQRAIITKSIGMGLATKNQAVFTLDLRPGDRLVIASDGVSDQLLEIQIESRLHEEEDDTRAEGSLQQGAMGMAVDGRHPRAKGDDIAALVHTIGEHGPDRAYLHSETQTQKTRETLEADLGRIRLGHGRARQEILRASEELKALPRLAPKPERLALMAAYEGAKERESTYRYHLEKTQLDLFDIQLPPRFEAGERVNVWREDFETPSLDRQMWTIAGYDPQSKTYAVRGPGGVSREVSRYELETVQSGLLVKLGDELPAKIAAGAMEDGFRVIAFDRDGMVVLMKETSGAIKRVRVKAQEVNERLFEQLYAAEQARQRMTQAIEDYHRAKERQESYRDEADLIEQIQKRQVASDAASKRG
ncbi:protein phosphatase 2C domain-containing protein [Candidatus Uhrbacteria bacterium]|nr:protein phosphatase 2C domain-containing protein [Candidatus Uhrbacteria bacterium]